VTQKRRREEKEEKGIQQEKEVDAGCSFSACFGPLHVYAEEKKKSTSWIFPAKEGSPIRRRRGERKKKKKRRRKGGKERNRKNKNRARASIISCWTLPRRLISARALISVSVSEGKRKEGEGGGEKEKKTPREAGQAGGDFHDSPARDHVLHRRTIISHLISIGEGRERKEAGKDVTDQPLPCERHCGHLVHLTTWLSVREKEKKKEGREGKKGAGKTRRGT